MTSIVLDNFFVRALFGTGLNKFKTFYKKIYLKK